MIDTGIWPEHPCFSDRTGSNGSETKDGKLSYQQIPGWRGKCEPGAEFSASNCNQKLIGARFYNVGAGGNAGVLARFPGEFNSPRDFNGHGTHTSSTAGGNQAVPATGVAAAFGSINGIAPRARIAMHKALWEQPDGTGSGSTVDLVAAIDQAWPTASTSSTTRSAARRRTSATRTLAAPAWCCTTYARFSLFDANVHQAASTSTWRCTGEPCPASARGGVRRSTLPAPRVYRGAMPGVRAGAAAGRDGVRQEMPGSGTGAVARPGGHRNGRPRSPAW